MPTKTSPAPVVDSEQRARALVPTQSFIVQAPAGSGKTALLTRRVLTLLATVDEPEEILAITFTRKAAAEMRARVVEALDDAQFSREGYELAQKALRRDAERGWRLLENPTRLRMSTIDSLCSMLAQQLPVSSTLGGVVNPVDDANALYREAARRRLKLHTDDYRRLLRTVGNRFDMAENLLSGMLASRDQWLRYRVIFEQEDRDSLRAWLEEQLAALVTQQLAVFEQTVKAGGVESILNRTVLPLLQHGTSTLEALGMLKPEDKTVRNLFMSLGQLPQLDAAHLQIWQAVISCLLTSSKKGELRKTVKRSEGFPTSAADTKLLGVLPADARASNTAMKDVLIALREVSGLGAAMGAVLALPQPVYAQHQWELLEELTTELPKLESTLHDVFVDQGTVDFIEIAMRAGRALGDEEAPTDLALALDLRLKHVLIDEFQDTSRSQFELFRRLVAGWQQGDGRTFFAVGDPMQSIYGFRAAEVSLFSTAREFGISDDVKLEPLTLSVNFRSSPDVVNWVNETFSDVFLPPDEAEVTLGAVAYSSSTAHQTVPGYVNIHPLVDSDADAAAQHVAALVQQTLATEEFTNDPTRRIAILVRSKAAAGPIFTALQNLGIANLSVEMDALGDQPVVMDLVSLTLALRFPHSRLHWMAVLRAPWCGLTLTDLHALTHDDNYARAMPLLLSDTERFERLSEDGQCRLHRFLAVMQPAIDHAPRSSVVSWVESVWLQLGGPILCARAVDRDAAEQCLQTLYALEAKGLLWQQRAIRDAMARLFAVTPDDGTAKVHIMTMHKAKGLEFDTVILPSLQRAPNSSRGQLLNWAVFDPIGDGRAAMMLAPMTERKSSASERSLVNLITQVKQAGEEQESRRLLYVACTRAVRELHVVASVKVSSRGDIKPTKGSLLEPLWPAVSEKFEASLQQHLATLDQDEPQISPGTDPTASDHRADAPTLRRVALDWEVPTLPSYAHVGATVPEEAEAEPHSVEYLWAGRSARAIGTVVHRHLQQFGLTGLPMDNTVDSLAPIVNRQLRQQGLTTREVEKSVPVVMRALHNVAQDERGQWLFNRSHQDVRIEWAVTSGNAAGTERRVIDRTFVTADGTRWIIDFKTGDHLGGDVEGFLSQQVDRYGPQLRRYAEILSTLEQGDVKLGLYFPLMQAFREVALHE